MSACPCALVFALNPTRRVLWCLPVRGRCTGWTLLCCPLHCPPSHIQIHGTHSLPVARLALGPKASEATVTFLPLTPRITSSHLASLVPWRSLCLSALLLCPTQIRCVAFDKTGTLTKGKPTVISLLCVEASGWSRERLLASAAAAEMHSEHPLAQAIVAYARHCFLFDSMARSPARSPAQLPSTAQQQQQQMQKEGGQQGGEEPSSSTSATSAQPLIRRAIDFGETHSAVREGGGGGVGSSVCDNIGDDSKEGGGAGEGLTGRDDASGGSGEGGTAECASRGGDSIRRDEGSGGSMGVKEDWRWMPRVERFESLPGLGLQCSIDGDVILVRGEMKGSGVIVIQWFRAIRFASSSICVRWCAHDGATGA